MNRERRPFRCARSLAISGSLPCAALACALGSRGRRRGGAVPRAGCGFPARGSGIALRRRGLRLGLRLGSESLPASLMWGLMWGLTWGLTRGLARGRSRLLRLLAAPLGAPRIRWSRALYAYPRGLRLGCSPRIFLRRSSRCCSEALPTRMRARFLGLSCGPCLPGGRCGASGWLGSSTGGSIILPLSRRSALCRWRARRGRIAEPAPSRGWLAAARRG